MSVIWHESLFHDAIRYIRAIMHLLIFVIAVIILLEILIYRSVSVILLGCSVPPVLNLLSLVCWLLQSHSIGIGYSGFGKYFVVISRDVGLETWSWSRDRSRPLFWGLGLGLPGLGLGLSGLGLGGWSWARPEVMCNCNVTCIESRS